MQISSAKSPENLPEGFEFKICRYISLEPQPRRDNKLCGFYFLRLIPKRYQDTREINIP